MERGVDERHLPGLLGSAGKSIAAMPDGAKMVEHLRLANSRDELLFILRSANLGVEAPARAVIQQAAQANWQEVKNTLLMSAELQVHERYHSSA